MKIGFYNPYFDGFGGGERYTLTLASYWSKKHRVDVFWHDRSITGEYQRRFGLDLSDIKIVHNIFSGKNVLKKLFFSRQYDLIFFLSDGSIPTSMAKRNILHFQIPFSRISAHAIKLKRYQAVVCNSMFTKANLDPWVAEKATVIYPPVRIDSLKSLRKKKYILSVGRFSSFHQAKKQAVLIEAFRKAQKAGRLKDWTLIFVGGLLPSDRVFFETLKSEASGLAVEFHPNISLSKLHQWYAESPIYWHAAGFGETNPVLAEHFGIAVVEAMAAGSLPVVYDWGGLSEIVTHKVNGFVWRSMDELIDYSVALETKSTLRAVMKKEAARRAKDFGEQKFLQSFDTLLERIF